MAKKILIIEDDVFLGDVLVQKLKGEGFEAILSRDGKEGYQKIKESKPDLILLDIILPTMNGYEILEAKQKDPSISGIPVIIISNSGQPVEINRALTLGVKDYLVKAQFDPEEVLVKVRLQLQGGVGTPESASLQPSPNPSGKSSDLSGKTIMWVEDDRFLSDIIARKLTTTHCALVHADNGEEAINILKSQTPDIILLDILLSGIDGFEILRQIKADERLKNIPVILLSNLGQQTDIDKGKELGAARFLIKATVTLDEIIDEIKAVLAESKRS